MSSELPLFLWCIIRWNMNGKRKSYLSLPVESKGSSWSTTYFSLDLVDRKQATLAQRSHLNISYRTGWTGYYDLS